MNYKKILVTSLFLSSLFSNENLNEDKLIVTYIHITASQPSHALNNKLVKTLLADESAYEIIESKPEPVILNDTVREPVAALA